MTANYEPFGEEWKKEIRRASVNMLQAMFGVQKLPEESKNTFINRLSMLGKSGKI